jgi:N-acyl homoserine lactone hydrolase
MAMNPDRLDVEWSVDIVWVADTPPVPLHVFVAGYPPEVEIKFPCFAYLLTSPFGTIFVDTGPDPKTAVAQGFAVTGDPAKAMQRALGNRGRSRDDVDTVVHTHLHYDHMQNDWLFPNARVLVAGTEVAHALDSEGRDFYFGASELVAELGSRLVRVEGEMAPLPGLWLIPSGGHTPGHLVIVALTRWGKICIAGDVIPLVANVAAAPPRCFDRKATAKFLKRVSDEGWIVLPGHEPGFRGVGPIDGLFPTGRELSAGKAG